MNKIEFSRQDGERNIRLPTEINEEVAELVGIIIGDGHISKREGSIYQIFVTCSLTEDYDYFNTITNNLFFKNFNIKLKIIKYSGRGYFNAVRNSKAITNYLTKEIGIPFGKKSEIIEIPRCILNSDNGNNKVAFIRGISDTDFCLTFRKGGRKSHSYPVIKGKFKGHLFVEQLRCLLESFGLKCSTFGDNYYDERFKKTNNEKVIQISGRKNLEVWMNIIGFKNPRHYTKYLIWKNYGFCPPNTTLEERKQILNRKSCPHSFYEKNGPGKI